jgi:putative sterol carrier protein
LLAGKRFKQAKLFLPEHILSKKGTTVADILPYLEKIQKKFDDPYYQNIFKGYSKTFQIVFSDISETYSLKIEEGVKVILEKGKTEKPNLTVTTTSDILIGIMEKRVNPMTAYSLRKVTSVGSMDDLLKLQKLL